MADDSTQPPWAIRFGYHKCLTKFMNRVFPQNRHFLAMYEQFVRHLEAGNEPRFVSLNNCVLMPERKIFKNARILHLIRHPKDIIVSGYFYHKRGAEGWTEAALPYRFSQVLLAELRYFLNDKEHRFVAGCPSTVELLSELPQSKGFMAEMVWLKYWKGFNPVPYYECPWIRTMRFEDIVADQRRAVLEMCDHWEIPEQSREEYAERAESLSRTPTSHVRDSSPEQHLQWFDADVEAFYERQFNGIHRALDYD